jgi:hypothetical protein
MKNAIAKKLGMNPGMRAKRLSMGEVPSDQLARWCCIDRLNSQCLSGTVCTNKRSVAGRGGARGIERGEVVMHAIVSSAISSQALLGTLPCDNCRAIPRR